ncbi:MAG TPA: TIGR03435 family protein, partial [Acidobacteriaceae bacterium]|nr:TIGR03435 family protein [Acidobacteriaceae bacterium]
MLVVALAAVAGAQTTPAPPASADAKPLAFEVVTIKPDNVSRGWRLQPTSDGYTGTYISLYKLVQEAYGFPDPKLISGGPDWIDKDKFDFEAKFDPSDIPNAKDLTYRQRADMLRAVLADRFQLKIHFEKKDFPVFNLVVANSGPKMPEWKPGNPANEDNPEGCLFRRSRAGFVEAENCPAGALLLQLRYITGRPVLDKTGLTAHYHVELHWTP